MSPSNSSGVGTKRTWDVMNGNDTDVSIVNVKQQGDINQTDDTSDIAWGELDSLLTSFTAKDTTNDTPTESGSFNVTTNVKSVYITKPTMSKKDVRDELAIAYAEENVNLNFLPRFVHKQKDKHRTACHMYITPEKHIEMFSEMAI